MHASSVAADCRYNAEVVSYQVSCLGLDGVVVAQAITARTATGNFTRDA